MSQWAEIRHMHLSEGVPKKQVARRLGVDVKTVRRAVASAEPPVRRRSPKRGRALDPLRSEVEQLLRVEPLLTAKRIGQVLAPSLDGPVPERTLREFVAEVRGELRRPEAFVHRTHLPGHTMELDFGEAWAVVAGRKRKIKFLEVGTPAVSQGCRCPPWVTQDSRRRFGRACGPRPCLHRERVDPNGPRGACTREAS